MIKNSLKKRFFLWKQPLFLKKPYIFNFCSFFHFLALYHQYITPLTTRYAKYLIFYYSYSLYTITNEKINVFQKIAYDPVNRNVSLIFHCVLLFLHQHIFDLDEKHQLLESTFCYEFTWNNGLMTWDPDDFDGISKVSSLRTIIWWDFEMSSLGTMM